ECVSGRGAGERDERPVIGEGRSERGGDIRLPSGGLHSVRRRMPGRNSLTASRFTRLCCHRPSARAGHVFSPSIASRYSPVLSERTMKILVTGHHGYIGSVMTRILSDAGHAITGLDTYLYEGLDFGVDEQKIPAIRKDIREVQPSDLRGFDAVIHLAALSN